MSAFGLIIRDARKRAKITLREASRRLEISPAYLSSLENNTEGSTPSDAILRRACKLFGLRIADMKLAAVGISKDNLRSLERVIRPGDARAIQDFYLTATSNGLSMPDAVKIFRQAVEATK